MTLDIKNYYLATTLAEKQHMLIHADLVPAEIIQAYNLQSKIHNGKTHERIDKCMHGLKEAGALAYE